MDNERRVQQVLAAYVRATDARDGKAQGALFTDDAVVQILVKDGSGSYQPLGEPLIGGAGVEYAVANLMLPHPDGGSSHHMTADTIIDVHETTAHLNAQFVMFEVSPDATIRPAESGYYDTDLALVGDEWLITGHRVLMDVLPTAAQQ